MTDLEIINEIQKVRSKNNVNWMDILRIAFTHAPEETREVFKRITNDDNLINELSKKLANNNSILLIGPGDSIKDLNPSPHQQTLAFSGDFKVFQDINFVPDYWTFLDPNTLVYLYNSHKKGEISRGFIEKLKSKTTLLYNNFQEDGSFYQYGLTTSRGETWIKGEFKNEILPYIKNLFKNSIKIECVTTNDYLVEEIEAHEYYKKHTMIENPEDKFSKFILPLVFYYFPNVKDIYSIGFGDFDFPRYKCPIGETNDYNSFKSSFNSVKFKLSNYLHKSKKQIIFLNSESYFNQL